MRLAVLDGVDDPRGPRAHAREVLAIVATMMNTQECTFVIVFGSRLFCAGKHCTRTFASSSSSSSLKTIFFKNSARHRTSVNEKKNRKRCRTIFHSYCRYYVLHYYRLTTVVMTVATRHGITTSLYHDG